ncbi:MAG: PD-(D/E)XK nuclease family protein [Gammaproteobacteria bacterium]|nr:PD-(D/E)XK nuclease family protein [Gammaproteobacteria bacterium]
MPAERLGGGSGLLKDQAACPFRAYARHRLRAVEVEEAGPGLDARARGELVHGVLAKFWARVGDQEGLRALDDAGRQSLVAAAVAAEIEAHPHRALFGAEFWRLEQTRVTALACEWLAGELERPPFTVVALEEAFKLDLAGLPLRLRADRIDRLAHGGELLVDYKTGRAKRASWEPPRPDEPQLPLYALAREAALRGIAFGAVRKGECAFEDFPKGIVCGGESVEREAEWRTALPMWRAELETLAREYLAGHAVVQPKDGATTCRYCELALFCRVNEAGPLAAEDEEVADDAS